MPVFITLLFTLFAGVSAFLIGQFIKGLGISQDLTAMATVAVFCFLSAQFMIKLVKIK